MKSYMLFNGELFQPWNWSFHAKTFLLWWLHTTILQFNLYISKSTSDLSSSSLLWLNVWLIAMLYKISQKFLVQTESTLHFLVAQWRDKLPPGLTVRKATIDPPSEEDCCSCCFILEKDSGIVEDSDLSLTYQWFRGDKTGTNFMPIEGATSKVKLFNGCWKVQKY